MNEKEQLKNRLKEIEKAEYLEMIEREYPKFEKLIGICFKAENSYGANEHWYTYYKILEIHKYDLYESGGKILAKCVAFTFEETSRGEIMIDQYDQTYIHCIGERISEDEFKSVLNEKISKIRKILS